MKEKTHIKQQIKINIIHSFDNIYYHINYKLLPILPKKLGTYVIACYAYITYCYCSMLYLLCHNK